MNRSQKRPGSVGKPGKPALPKRNIGRGYWLKVARIRENRVAKFFSEPVSKPEARRICKAHDMFVQLLREAGIEVPETKIVGNEQKNGNVRLRILQTGFTPDVLGEHVVKTAQREKAIDFAGQLVDETLKIFRYNREVAGPQYGLIVGADFKPDNVALVNGKISFIDTFSPHIRSLKEPDHIHPAFARYFAKRGYLLNKLTRGYISQTVYDPEKRLASLIAELTRLRPELARSFAQKARERIERETDPAVRTQLLKAVRKWPILRAKAMGRLIGYLGKRKGMQIKLG